MTTQRLDIDYGICWQSSWHVGSGYRIAAVDRLMRQRVLSADGDGMPLSRPLIPGAQIKGVLRHQCERLAATFGADVVNPHDVDRDRRQQLLDNFAPLADSELIVDRLFGSRYEGGCLSCSDALPKDAAVDDEMTTYARTGIDRATGTTKHQRLFVTQAASAESGALRGRIRARHRPEILTLADDGFPYEYTLLLAGLLAIDRLGGDKSSGRGGCIVQLDHLRWNGESLDVAQALESFRQEDEWVEWVELVREDRQ